jgi:hypothetical protein
VLPFGAAFSTRPFVLMSWCIQTVDVVYKSHLRGHPSPSGRLFFQKLAGTTGPVPEPKEEGRLRLFPSPPDTQGGPTPGLRRFSAGPGATHGGRETTCWGSWPRPCGTSLAPGRCPLAKDEPVLTHHRWHPLTRSLLDRAGRAEQRLDRPRVERIIHEVAEEHGRPVIKWMEDPARELQHLSRYPLSELVQMPTTRLWLSPPSVTATNEEAAERAFDLYWHATQALRVEEHGRALMAPKLVAKERTMAAQSRPKAIFEAERSAELIAAAESRICPQPGIRSARWRFIIS